MLSELIIHRSRFDDLNFMACISRVRVHENFFEACWVNLRSCDFVLNARHVIFKVLVVSIW